MTWNGLPGSQRKKFTDYLEVLMMSKTPTADRAVACNRRPSTLRSAMGALLACAATAFPMVSSALPVIPGAVGYGIDTPAGRGGKIYRVTNLNASGAGSLKDCVAASGPRVCVFEVSGTIKLTSDLHVWNPNLTIAGQTAPSPGIIIRGAALNINASDVLVQHIRIRVGDDAEGPSPTNRDALKIESMTGIKNIVIDHCSVSWAVDETLTLWDKWDNVTLSNNIVSEGLRESIKTSGLPAGYGILIGPTKGKVSISNNLLAHILERNPLSRGEQMVFVNNVVYNRAHQDVDLQSEDGIVTNSTVVGNVFIRGNDFTREYNKPILLRTDSKLGVPSGSKVYVSDNAAVENNGSDMWSVVSTNTSESLGSFKASSPPAWPAGLTALPTKNDAVLSKVLKYSGARPADRDSVDARVVKSVRDRSGQIINCVSADGSTRCSKNAGGWPSLAQNRRTLVLPSDPSTVTSSGYTKLEVWLHQKAAEVEGRTSSLPKPPVLAVK
jgi:pectate lyase